MHVAQLPEILWTPLEDLALQVKMMELASSISTKHSALVPAPPTAVAASSSLLTPIQLATHNFTSGLTSMRSLFQSLGLITPLISPVDTALPQKSFDFEPERLPVPCVVERFFAKALEPPRLVSVKRSVRKLQDIGALRCYVFHSNVVVSLPHLH